jgi:hypothetical protein
VERRGYFGPRGGAPTKEGVQCPVPKRKKDAASKYSAKASKLGSTSTEPISNVVPAQHQRWFDFDPHMDVHIGDFVGVQVPKSARRNGELFWVAKVKRRWRVLGSMVLADKTKRPPRWTGRDAGSLCELFSSHMGARPNV